MKDEPEPITIRLEPIVEELEGPPLQRRLVIRSWQDVKKLAALVARRRTTKTRMEDTPYVQGIWERYDHWKTEHPKGSWEQFAADIEENPHSMRNWMRRRKRF